MVCPECRHGDRRPRAFCPYCAIAHRSGGDALHRPPPLGGAVPACLIALGSGGGDAVVGVAGGEGLRSCAGGGYMDTLDDMGTQGVTPAGTLRIVCMGQGPGAPPAGRREKRAAAAV